MANLVRFKIQRQNYILIKRFLIKSGSILINFVMTIQIPAMNLDRKIQFKDDSIAIQVKILVQSYQYSFCRIFF